MRAVLVASVPTCLLVVGAFFACGGTSGNGSDGGKDVAVEGGLDGPTDGFNIDSPPFEPDATVTCQVTGTMTATGGLERFDPVAYCVERVVLQDQHDRGFSPKTGTAARWNYQTLLVDDAGGPVHDVRNDASYASSCSDFYRWSTLYTDSSSLDDAGGSASNDMTALAALLEKELTKLPDDYDGEFYFNLRNFAVGLKYLSDNDDSSKIDDIAFAYGRQIYSSFYFGLPLSGTGDGGGKDAGGKDGAAEAGPIDGASGETGPVDASSDSGGDPGAIGDGILGVNQEPSTGSPGILYQPDKVASAAYALLDLANSNPTDPDAEKWVAAARRALDHIHDKARDPSTGLYQASLVTTGGGKDALGTLTTPHDLLSSDVQATVTLYLIRANELVDTTPSLDAGSGGDGGLPLDGSVLGILAPLGDFPFLARADALINAMDALWDVAKLGYLDGYVPSTHELLATKSTRPNAYMFAALHLQLYIERVPRGEAGAPERARVVLLNDLRLLLSNLNPTTDIANPGTNTFISTVAVQAGYFDTLSAGFGLLGSSSSPTQDYTAAAASAVIAAFNEQLAGFHP
jgi:hypothetical protein